MEQERKHSPLPYTQEKSLIGFEKENCSYVLANCDTGIFSKSYNEKNAEFIIKACNNHYGLLEALVKISGYTGGRTAECSQERLWGILNQIGEIADNAIAATEAR